MWYQTVVPVKASPHSLTFLFVHYTMWRSFQWNWGILQQQQMTRFGDHTNHLRTSALCANEMPSLWCQCSMDQKNVSLFLPFRYCSQQHIAKSNSCLSRPWLKANYNPVPQCERCYRVLQMEYRSVWGYCLAIYIPVKFTPWKVTAIWPWSGRAHVMFLLRALVQWNAFLACSFLTMLTVLLKHITKLSRTNTGTRNKNTRK